MWNFMKPKPIAPVCHMQPVHEIKHELANYKRLIIAEIDACYQRICEALSVTDPHDLETLHDIITQYNEIQTAIDTKIELMQAELEAYSEINNFKIVEKYDSATRSLRFSIGKDD